MSKEPNVYNAKEILEMLKNGMTREDIAEHFNVSMAEIREVFKHPDLKGRKTRQVPKVRVVGLEEETQEETPQETATEENQEENIPQPATSVQETVSEDESEEDESVNTSETEEKGEDEMSEIEKSW